MRDLRVIHERRGPLAVVRRWLKRKVPYRCKVCSYTVPVVGPRSFQARMAWDHLAEMHGAEPL